MKITDIGNIIDIPHDYFVISEPKLKISKAIKEQLDNKKLTVRGFAKQLDMKHPQIIRVTGCNNYNIDTLLKILDGLNLEIVIQQKK